MCYRVLVAFAGTEALFEYSVCGTAALTDAVEVLAGVNDADGRVVNHMKPSKFLRRVALGLAGLPLLASFASYEPMMGPVAASGTLPAVIYSDPLGPVVAMRRLTESQYRNSIADVFGPDIKVAGRFEPIVRPTNELISVATTESTISPAGLEQFDAIARNIASQVIDSANRDLFVKCKPADAKQPDPNCASEVLTPIGRHLFRRPLTLAERDAYVKMAGDAVGPTASFYEGLKLSLAAMLVSPNFLYIVERAQPDPAHPGTMTLDNYSRAARLSFLLWDTTPNAALLDAASQGRLTNQAELTTIARGMIASPLVENGVRAFFTDMLLFEKFEEMSKDPVVFPRYNQDVATAMPEQLLRTIVDLLVTRNGDYREMFTTRRTFVNRALGPLYEVPVGQSQGWVPYEFGPNEDRAGILGQAAFLSPGEAQQGRSSPTIRGRAIREVLLCQVVPNPPGNVSFDEFEKKDNKAKPTARIRLATHSENPVCSGCHSITDPIGLALEKFDGIGAFRAMENDTPIDTTGVLDGVSFTTVAGLGKAISANKSATQCVAARAFEYATGRTNKDNDALVTALEEAFTADRYRFPALLMRIATMPETYRVPAPKPDAESAKVAALTSSDQQGAKP
jgi:hypothetical protein